MKYSFLIILFVLFDINCFSEKNQPAPLSPDQPVRGWTILSDDPDEDLYVIGHAAQYHINHLQLSHQVIHNLKEIRNPEKRELVERLTAEAHQKGIQEVVLWDHCLYDPDYYPDRFKTGPGRTINLDNPAFWEWLKNDYREMLDLVPGIQGLVLTFIETGTRVEKQFSEKMKTDQEKLAAVVNAVASVVIEERGLNLYARTFSYTIEEYQNITGAIKLFKNDRIRLMIKETPHDFFLTHPDNFFAGQVARPTIIEFDTGNEFNGQDIIANTWPQYIFRRWSDFLNRDHVIGYTARTDRYGDTRIIGRPAEINLYALRRLQEDKSLTVNDIWCEFIRKRYGEKAFPLLQKAFENSFDIVTSVFYTMGSVSTNHSSLNYDPYNSNYARHISEKWVDPPVVLIRHGINKEFHYFKDILNHLAPAWAKAGGTQLDELSSILKEGWLQPGERMNEEYLHYILTEKDYGIRLAEESLKDIKNARSVLSEKDYPELLHYFERTLLTAKLHRAVCAAYFGFRIYARGEPFRTREAVRILSEGLMQIPETAAEIENYSIRDRQDNGNGIVIQKWPGNIISG
jgi:hypothetical protein